MLTNNDSLATTLINIFIFLIIFNVLLIFVEILAKKVVVFVFDYDTNIPRENKTGKNRFFKLIINKSVSS